MVQASLGGGADVHTGPFADSLQTLQDLDLVLVIGLLDAVDIRQLALRQLFRILLFLCILLLFFVWLLSRLIGILRRRVRDFLVFAWDKVLIVHFCLFF